MYKCLYCFQLYCLNKQIHMQLPREWW